MQPTHNPTTTNPDIPALRWDGKPETPGDARLVNLHPSDDAGWIDRNDKPLTDPSHMGIGEVWYESCPSCGCNLGSIYPMCDTCAQVDDVPPLEPAPTVTVAPIPVSKTLRDASAYLLANGWFQGDMFNDPDQPTPAACALGAVRMATLGTPAITAESLRLPFVQWVVQQSWAIGVLADYVNRTQLAEDLSQVVTIDPEQVVIGWNDHPARNIAHVLAAMQGAAEEWDRIHTSAGVCDCESYDCSGGCCGLGNCTCAQGIGGAE
jgi:hypothetical protein